MINIEKRFTFIFLVLLLIGNITLVANSISALKGQKNVLYFGGFHNLPNNDFCLLYDGELIKLQECGYTLKDNLLADINLLFVSPEKIKFMFDSEHTVLSLKLKTSNYKFYKLSYLPTSNETSWDICEQKILDDIIPLNTVIIPLDPCEIEISVQNVANKSNNLAIKLPTIKLVSKCHKSLNDLINESYLRIMMLTPFHAKQQIKSNIQNSTQISMIL